MEAASDDDLVRMYREGDADAFDALFARYSAAVYHLAGALLGPDGGAADVLQETFLAVARNARRYVPRGRFRAWLMRIVRNRCLNRLDARRRRREVLGRTDVPVIDPPSHEPSPAARAARDEQREIIAAAIARLPDRQREAIALYAFQRMRYREIAEVMTMPINTVKTLIHRARANLARALEPLSRESNRAL